MSNIEEKLANLENDKKFLEKFNKTETTEEAVQLFSEYGVDITVEEFEKLLEANNGELSEEKLAEAAGGLGVFGDIRHPPVTPPFYGRWVYDPRLKSWVVKRLNETL